MSEWEPILVEMTGYCPCSICCPGTSDGRTANNTDVRKVPYNLAGDIYNFKMGVEIFVPLGYDALDRVRHASRIFKVDDRGGGLNSESTSLGIPRLDLRFKEHAWAKRFGRKRFIVFVRRPDVRPAASTDRDNTDRDTASQKTDKAQAVLPAPSAPDPARSTLLPVVMLPTSP